jgi:putative oxidoreductase
MAVAAVTHVVFRVGVGLLFLQHALQKLFGFFGATPVPIASRLGAAGIIELVGSILIVLGLLTRPVAIVLTLEMLIAFVLVHAPRGGLPIKNGGELPRLFALIFLFLAGHGAGPVSVDAALAGRRRSDLSEVDARRASTA